MAPTAKIRFMEAFTTACSSSTYCQAKGCGQQGQECPQAGPDQHTAWPGRHVQRSAQMCTLESSGRAENCHAEVSMGVLKLHGRAILTVQQL
jgi:hypothetical protein